MVEHCDDRVRSYEETSTGVVCSRTSGRAKVGVSRHHRIIHHWTKESLRDIYLYGKNVQRNAFFSLCSALYLYHINYCRRPYNNYRHSLAKKNKKEPSIDPDMENL
jgi:hypothetical protein